MKTVMWRSKLRNLFFKKRTEDDKIVENDKNTASILNEFFSNIITTLGSPQNNETEQVIHNIGDPLMKAILKYRFHPSIVAIKKNFKSGLSFNFS